MKRSINNIIIGSFILTAGLTLFSISRKKVKNKKVEKIEEKKEPQEEKKYYLLKEFKKSDNKNLKEVI